MYIVTDPFQPSKLCFFFYTMVSKTIQNPLKKGSATKDQQGLFSNHRFKFTPIRVPKMTSPTEPPRRFSRVAQVSRTTTPAVRKPDQGSAWIDRNIWKLLESQEDRIYWLCCCCCCCIHSHTTVAFHNIYIRHLFLVFWAGVGGSLKNTTAIFRG